MKVISDEELALLLTKCNQDILTAREAKLLSLWANESDDNRMIVDIMTNDGKYDSHLDHLVSMLSYNENEAWAKIEASYNKKHILRTFTTKVAIACCVLIVVVLAVGKSVKRSEQDDLFATNKYDFYEQYMQGQKQGLLPML